MDYILFTGESENKGKNALCLLAEVTDFKEIEPVEVMGKIYTMECHVNKKVQVITNNVPTRNYENNVGSLQQRVLSFESKEEIQKFLKEEGAVLVTEEM